MSVPLGEDGRVTDHCCTEMARRVDWHCDAHADPYACPDALVGFVAKFQEYGLIVHDGGTATIGILFCLWCGQRLPESQRDRWFDELEALGIEPGEGGVPVEFEGDSWLRLQPRGV